MKKILFCIALSIMNIIPVFCALPAAEPRPTNSPITRCDHIEICAKASCIAASYAIIPCGAAVACCLCSECVKSEHQHSLYYEKEQQAAIQYKICAAGACCFGVATLLQVFRSEAHRLQQHKMQAHTIMHRD